MLIGEGDAGRRRLAVAARWDREAAAYDQGFDHVVGDGAERAAWNRVLRLLEGERDRLVALDVGTGTGFLALELAARGHAVTGIDLAPRMLALARRKASQLGLVVDFRAGDAERPPFGAPTFDLVVSRHVLWSLSDREDAVRAWLALLRRGGRVAVLDGDWSRSAASAGTPPPHAPESLAADEVADLLAAQGCAVGIDPLDDLVAALDERGLREGRDAVRFPRYLVWGDVPG